MAIEAFAIFRSPSIRLLEKHDTLYVVTTEHGTVLAAAFWRLVDVYAHGSKLILRGTFVDLGSDPRARVIDGIAPEDAQRAADFLVARCSLPKPLEVISAADVEREPERYHGRHLEVSALWKRGFEWSSFAGAWLFAHDLRARSERDVAGWTRARGIWRCESGCGYGHGAARAGFYAYEVEDVPTPVRL